MNESYRNNYRDKINNSRIGITINNTKLGKLVEELSNKYSPRPSDLVQLPFAVVGGTIGYVGLIATKIGEALDPKRESFSSFFIGFAELPIYVSGVIAIGIGEAITYPVRRLEDALFGERDMENIFNIMYPISDKNLYYY